jgi:hypothetical protein
VAGQQQSRTLPGLLPAVSTAPACATLLRRHPPYSSARLQEQVKAHITDLMLSAPPRVRAQLSEALSIISSHDFPARWQTLLPHLVDKMASPDQQLVNGVLSTADSIYQRYRHVHSSLMAPLLGDWVLLGSAADTRRCVA